MTLRFDYAPLWVSVVYRMMEWFDYSVISPVSSWLTYTRIQLLDRHCQCEKCLRRDTENPGWAGRPIQ
jgi:hypothetical protein